MPARIFIVIRVKGPRGKPNPENSAQSQASVARAHEANTHKNKINIYVDVVVRENSGAGGLLAPV
jgi:hypothetical protein